MGGSLLLPGGLGIGAAPAGYGPAGAFTSPTGISTTTAVSCRTINTVTQDYDTDPNGNPTAMDGTANRVYLLCAYNDVPSELITPQYISQRMSAITSALKPLTGRLNPAISNLIITSQTSDNGVSFTVSYMNLATAQPESVIVQ